MAETWFISDTHFGHANILKFEPILRPFKNIEEHDQFIINEWNRLVGENDIVYHLGDVAFKDFNITLLAELKGHKRVVLGNHDQFNRLAPYFENFYGVKYWKEGILLSHIPVHIGQMERFKFNFHGHLHSNLVKDADPRYFNLSCEWTYNRPIHYDELKERMNAIQS